MLQPAVRAFVREELQPREAEVDLLDEIPDEMAEYLKKRSKEMGLWNLYAPEEYGGSGINTQGQCVLNDESGWASWVLRGLISGAGAFPILYHCNDEQKDRFLYPSLRGERRGCFALTEPNAGSDAQHIETTAIPDGDDVVINGTKHFITGGDKADHAIVFGVSDPQKRGRGGITCVLVEKGTPGFEVARIQQTMGLRGSHQVELSFRDVRVPRRNVIGEVGGGFKFAMSFLVGARLTLGAQFNGEAERCLSLATQYAKHRMTFGEPLANRQAIQWMLADTALEIYSSRCMVEDAARRSDEGQDVRVEAGMVKLHASEVVNRAVDRAIQVYGGVGYTTDTPLERIYRDARVYRIFEGASEVQKILITRSVLNRY